MALTVENGTGLSNADSYISLADANTYFTSMGDETWTDADDTEKEAALRRATYSLDAWLRGRWKGVKKTSTQALAWPRIKKLDSTEGVKDEDGYELATDAVPLVVQRATAEIALIELSERFIQQSVSNSNTVASESVGPISVTYRDSAPAVKYYPHIEAMLRGIASVGGVQLDMSIGLTDEELDALDGTDNDPFDFPEYFTIIKNY